MRDDFCAFILTHGRPDKVLTYRTLRRAGYTGKIFIVVDDEDKTRHQYIAEFGKQVLVFSKADIASRFDEADNFGDRRSIFYARNACFDLAKLVGCKYFIQLDDDYHEFQFRVDRNYDQAYFPIRKLDAILSEMLAYYESIPALSIAMSQGGDFLGDNGGHASWVKRKAMNSFICSVDRPFSFMGRINEDVNTYTNLGRCGELFMTIGAVQLGQKQTQKNSGGMTELYLDSGTYVKSFYSVMYAPSCVKICHCFPIFFQSVQINIQNISDLLCGHPARSQRLDFRIRNHLSPPLVCRVSSSCIFREGFLLQRCSR